MPYTIFALYCLLWTLIPVFTLTSPPLDVVEMLAWGQSFEWGYFKHPPLPAWLAEAAYQLVGGHVWGVYALSQLCLFLTFVYVFKLARVFFSENKRAELAAYFLFGVYFYSYPTPEFNHNVIQMPLWAGFVYHAARIYLLKKNDWIYLGVFAGLAMLAKYSSALIILSFVFVYFLRPQQDFRVILKNPWLYFGITVAFLIFLPHLIWLVNNDFMPFQYAANRFHENSSQFSGRILNPLEFVLSQFAHTLPAFVVLWWGIKKPVTLMNEKSERSFFITLMCFGPMIISVVLAVLFEVKLLPMWGMPYWNLLGIFVLYRVASTIDTRKYRQGLTLVAGLILCFYGFYQGLGMSARTSFPMKEIAAKIETVWKENTNQPLQIIIGDEWLSGTMSLALPGRPVPFLYYDLQKAPWANRDDVYKKGAAVLWYFEEKDADTADLKKPNTYPDQLQKVFKLKHRKKQFAIGFIWPKVNNESS